MIGRCPFKRIDGQSANKEHYPKQNKPNGELDTRVGTYGVHKAMLNDSSQRRVKNDDSENDVENGYRNQPT